MNHDLNEAETRAELIDPALKRAGWGVVDGSRVRREVITLGRLQGAGSRATPDIADYVLEYRNHKLAVIEAKRVKLGVTEGLGQAKKYAEKLETRIAFSTNGLGIYRVDMQTGEEGEVDQYPSPEELWQQNFESRPDPERYWLDRFSTVPFNDKGGQWQPRYYQHNAINHALSAIASGEDRILLTLATGTGKTAIAFQISWKLYQSRWNLKDWRQGLEYGQEPGRRPTILFLADRNILAAQAYNAFSAFSEDARIRIDPQVIRQRGSVPKNGSIFFTIFQTFMTGQDEDDQPRFNYGDYPPDFFDLIVIDECHRGGARDESRWRDIMNYFSPAVQLGLTATPKRTHNVDTYAYFKEPVYTYSLRDGINDGFLTPFKVKQISTTLDQYRYQDDDWVVEGQVDKGKEYDESDFNRIIEIRERELKRVELLMSEIDQGQKTLVFCATQNHAAMVRDMINQVKDSSDPNYCARVTANDGQLGEQQLRVFQNNEKLVPTILTTSRKLSTGVDALNIRNIVLFRPINTMIEFKQIIGRGTRLYEGKDYFTIYDFVKAYQHFNDPDWDGEPEEPEPVEPGGDGQTSEGSGEERQMVKIKLADGKERTIQHMMSTSFWGPEGKPISAAEFIERLFGDLPQLFRDEAELRNLWGNPVTRRNLLNGLEDRGYGQDQLAELKMVIEAEHSDLFDVLAYIRFAQDPISRRERVARRKPQILAGYTDQQQEFLDFVLDQYVQVGVQELDEAKLPQLLELKYQSTADARPYLGRIPEIRNLFIGFQQRLYARTEAA